jgi:hypothetical protein
LKSQTSGQGKGQGSKVPIIRVNKDVRNTDQKTPLTHLGRIMTGSDHDAYRLSIQFLASKDGKDPDPEQGGREGVSSVAVVVVLKYEVDDDDDCIDESRTTRSVNSNGTRRGDTDFVLKPAVP